MGVHRYQTKVAQDWSLEGPHVILFHSGLQLPSETKISRPSKKDFSQFSLEPKSLTYFFSLSSNDELRSSSTNTEGLHASVLRYFVIYQPNECCGVVKKPDWITIIYFYETATLEPRFGLKKRRRHAPK